VIYLDNNATTLAAPSVVKRISEVLAMGPCNPASPHSLGQQARALFDDALELIGHSLGTPLGFPGAPTFVVTSGGTEANNLALNGLRGGNGPIVVSRIEHASVLEVADAMFEVGRPVHYLDALPNGTICINHLDRILSELGHLARSTVVAVMSANNETGVQQPIVEVARQCRHVGAALHVDASQSIGKVPLDIASISPTSLTISPHKFHGPVGIGGLWLAPGESLVPLLRGGSQQLGLRPGTEPLSLVVGMAEGLAVAQSSLPQHSTRITTLRDQLEDSLIDRFPELVIHGKDAPRLPNTSCLSFPAADRQSLLMALDLAGLACSSGAACSSGSSPPSHVLLAMRAGDDLARTMLRFSLSRLTTDEEITRAVEIISTTYGRFRK
jgi:cysteine desulfurase